MCALAHDMRGALLLLLLLLLGLVGLFHALFPESLAPADEGRSDEGSGSEPHDHIIRGLPPSHPLMRAAGGLGGAATAAGGEGEGWGGSGWGLTLSQDGGFEDADPLSPPPPPPPPEPSRLLDWPATSDGESAAESGRRSGAGSGGESDGSTMRTMAQHSATLSQWQRELARRGQL